MSIVTVTRGFAALGLLLAARDGPANDENDKQEQRGGDGRMDSQDFSFARLR